MYRSGYMNYNIIKYGYAITITILYIMCINVLSNNECVLFTSYNLVQDRIVHFRCVRQHLNHVCRRSDRSRKSVGRALYNKSEPDVRDNRHRCRSNSMNHLSVDDSLLGDGYINGWKFSHHCHPTIVTLSQAVLRICDSI